MFAVPENSMEKRKVLRQMARMLNTREEDVPKTLKRFKKELSK